MKCIYCNKTISKRLGGEASICSSKNCQDLFEKEISPLLPKKPACAECSKTEDLYVRIDYDNSRPVKATMFCKECLDKRNQLINKKHSCPVCNKLHIVKNIKKYSQKGDYAVVCLNDFICSSKCMKIYNETLANIDQVCERCGKRTNSKTKRVLLADYKKKKTNVLCKECM